MAELVDALDLGSSGETRPGSSPGFRIRRLTLLTPNSLTVTYWQSRTYHLLGGELALGGVTTLPDTVCTGCRMVYLVRVQLLRLRGDCAAAKMLNESDVISHDIGTGMPNRVMRGRPPNIGTASRALRRPMNSPLT